MKDEAPKIFISYSWSTRSHEEWVLGLATELCENGVDVVLDKWDLQEGQDAHAFMEQMVKDPKIKKVAIVSDRLYAEKADDRSGGVGTETQILTPEIYSAQDQTKFVAVLPERDKEGKPYLPTYYKSRVYIDLSSPDLYGSNFEQLLRWIFDKPLYVKPKLGNPPKLSIDDLPVTLQTTSLHRRALKAVRENDPQYSIAISDYFQLFSENLELFRIVKDERDFDEKVVQSIEAFLPYLNEIIGIFKALAKYQPNIESWDSMHHFLESILPYTFRPEEVKQWQRHDFDNFKFIVHELFLNAIAILAKHLRFDGILHLVQSYYYLPENIRDEQNPMVPFSVFREPLESLKRLNERKNLRLISYHSTLLNERAKIPVNLSRILCKLIYCCLFEIVLIV